MYILPFLFSHAKLLFIKTLQKALAGEPQINAHPSSK